MTAPVVVNVPEARLVTSPVMEEDVRLAVPELSKPVRIYPDWLVNVAFCSFVTDKKLVFFTFIVPEFVVFPKLPDVPVIDPDAALVVSFALPLVVV